MTRTARQLDLVYDPVGGDLSETALRVSCRPAAVTSSSASRQERYRAFRSISALLKRCSIVGVDWGGHIRANPAANIPLLKTLTAWASEGKIHPEPAASYPLEEAPAVLQRLLDRASIGKPVIRFRA